MNIDTSAIEKAARAEAEYAQDVQQNKKPPRPTDDILAEIHQAFGIDVHQPPEDVIDAVFDILDQNRGYDKRETWKKAMRLSDELMDALRTPVPVDVERMVKDNVDEALKKANAVIPKIQEAIENSGVTLPCTITVEPGKSDITNVNIYVTVGSAPELSVWEEDGKLTVDDIVEFDPEDLDELFSSKDETAQYFMLVKELQNPGSSKKDAWVSLYTARPKSDRAMYETGKIPAGVFFANNLSHVEGIAHDMGGRDLWKMVVNKKDLVQTLEGGIKYYQTVRPTKAKRVELLSAISGSASKPSLAQFLAKLYKDMTHSQTGLSKDAEVYLKHSALNLGQAARDLRYLFDYPRETSRMRSLSMRLKSLANNLKYTALPPQWHHTAEDLLDMEKVTVAQWLKHGYAPWDHPVERKEKTVASLRSFLDKIVCASAPDKYSHIDFSPPQGVRSAAARGLALRKEHGRGGTAVGVARARDLSNGTTISPSTAKRMKAYFDRHQVDKKGKGFSSGEEGYPSAGKIAWDLWGGDAGYSWAKKLVRQMEAANK